MATPSAEAIGIVAYLTQAGATFKVTDYNTPGIHTPTSWHYRPATGGIGTAVDLAGLTPSWDSPALLAIFAAFGPIEHKLVELIYSGAPYSIKNGQRVPRYAIDAHWNHIHAAVPVGTILTGGPLPDDPNLPNIKGPVTFTPVFDSTGTCTGYYIFSTASGEVHAFARPDTPGLPKVGYYGRSEVVT